MNEIDLVKLQIKVGKYVQGKLYTNTVIQLNFVPTCLLNFVNFSHELNMRKPLICIGKNKGADQLCSNCEADRRLCFCYTDSTLPLLHKFEISSF